MKIYSMLFAAIVVGLAGTSAQAADSKLRIVKSLPLGGKAQVESVPGVNAVTPFYSDITTFSGSAFAFGGTQSGKVQPGGTGLLTALSCDDLSLDPGTPNGSYTLNEVTFSVANLNSVDVEAAPTVLFFDQGTGALIDGVAFNKIKFDLTSVVLLTGDLSAQPITFPLDGNGEANIWMCQLFDDDNGTALDGNNAHVTIAQYDNLGAGLCDPPTVGSSPDNIYVSDNPFVPPYASLPSGSQGNFGGNPVANYCNELAQ